MSTNPPPGRGGENEWDFNEQPRSHWPSNAENRPNTGWGERPPIAFQQPKEQASRQQAGQQQSQNPPQQQNPPRQQNPAQPHGQYQPQNQNPPQGQNQPQSWEQGQWQAQNQWQGQGSSYAQGPPSGPRPRKRKGLIALFVVLIIVVGVGIGWGAATLFPRGSADNEAVSATDEPKEQESKNDESASAEPSSEPTESELPDDPAKALEQLKETDSQTVSSDLNGKWVPQLSSKKKGLEAEGKTWDEEAILEEHQSMREEFPRVQLVWSGDFKSFKENDFWITIVGIGYDKPEEALSWCSSHGLGPDNCYAKQLNTSGGYEGTTKLQD